jgi:hypothetical protein
MTGTVNLARQLNDYHRFSAGFLRSELRRAPRVNFLRCFNEDGESARLLQMLLAQISFSFHAEPNEHTDHFARLLPS